MLKPDKLSVVTVPSMDIEVKNLLRDIRKMPTDNICDMIATYNAAPWVDEFNYYAAFSPLHDRQRILTTPARAISWPL